MATIGKIQGSTGPRLTGQVADSTRRHREGPSTDEAAVVRESPRPRGLAAIRSKRRQDSNLQFDPARLRELTEKLQQKLDEAAPTHHQVSFRHDGQPGEYVIEIRNPNGEVIRQFPPEKVLNMQHRMDELSGMVIDRMT